MRRRDFLLRYLVDGGVTHPIAPHDTEDEVHLHDPHGVGDGGFHVTTKLHLLPSLMSEGLRVHLHKRVPFLVVGAYYLYYDGGHGFFGDTYALIFAIFPWGMEYVHANKD